MGKENLRGQSRWDDRARDWSEIYKPRTASNHQKLEKLEGPLPPPSGAARGRTALLRLDLRLPAPELREVTFLLFSTPACGRCYSKLQGNSHTRPLLCRLLGAWVP